ncbi:FAD-dependent oxidoreductase [Neptunicella marina]|uniref:FAD-dependent monooxygenase n=1 Tax=Neptunicella marina TaxID=2125989 RepID=A0A8J6J118_9ALTE|nr:FAD-dependent oxidoreductase [Neptunicella marina]MBC3767880.1 FAD-dependent monooxygenase [Neptunicella marina]
MSRTKRIAIVGAGVAGMALAILATKRGYQVTLFERYSKISSMGAGVTLWPNAMFVMHQMGLGKEMEKLGGAPQLMCQFDRHGNLQTEFDIATVNSLCGFISVSVLRRDLMNVLAGLLNDLGVEIRFDCSITAAKVTELAEQHDLVVGADGRMSSVVRESLFENKVTPEYHGFLNIIGISRQRKHTLDNTICDFRGLGQRFGIVPVNDEWCYWAGAWKSPIDNNPPQQYWYDELCRRFQHWPQPVQNVLQYCDRTSVNRIFVHDIDPLPYWHKDNVVIIGDAAHAALPTSGQGACQALEDAWHLVRLLTENAELEVVLRTFYQQRNAKTSAAQLVGRQLANQIFSQQPEPRLPSSHISASDLSQFWMQGLRL